MPSAAINVSPAPADSDLDALSREALVAEVRKLRTAIRAHRDASGHALCWFHPKLWGLLPEQRTTSGTGMSTGVGTAGEIDTARPEDFPAPAGIPDWPQFMRGCVAYRASLDAQCPHAPRTDEEF